jgi:DNA gyrase subunit A
MRTVRENEEVVCVSSKGMVVRSPVSDISTIGRNTQGVRVIRLAEDDSFVAVAVVMPREQEERIGDELNGDAAPATEPEESTPDDGDGIAAHTDE